MYKLSLLAMSGIFIGSLLFPSFLLAQGVSAGSIISPISASDVSAELSDENPGPNETISIAIDSFAFDINSALTTWYVNGKKVASGYGIKTQTITTGKLGVRTSISIVVSTPAGDVSKDFSIIPATVDMTWEALTYTPPFFKGKPLFTNQATVKFIAYPHVYRNGVEVNPGNLVYTWSNNGTVFADQSGYGKTTFSTAGAFIPRPMTIEVKATDPNTGSTAVGQVSLSPQRPLTLLYKNDPLYGIQYEKALVGNYSLAGREAELVVTPYYFSTASVWNNLLTYNWQINGIGIGDGENSPDKIFRAVGDSFGTSNISVSIEHTSRILQTGDANLSVTFEKPTTGSLF